MSRIALAVSLSALSLAAQGWVDRTPTNPSASPGARRNAAMCWDAAHGYVLMYGGVSPVVYTIDTWSWNGTSWSAYAPSGPLNPVTFQSNQQSAMVFHPPTNEVVMVTQGQTYTWNGSVWVARAVNIGSINSGVAGDVALARDPVRGETVLFVGSRGTTTVSETYVWDGFAWSARPTPSHPGPVGAFTMAFDSVAGRLLLQTTASGLSTYWEWTGSNWLQRFYAQAPAAGGAMVTDSSRNSIVMFDGVMNSLPNHTWLLANGNARQPTTLVEPGRRTGAAIAFDPVRNKVVLFGGTNVFEFGDTWGFTPGADATYATFGAGCPGTRGMPTLAAQQGSLPRIGQTFSLQIGNLPFNATPFLFLGFSNSDFSGTPLPFSLAPFGANGCNVLVSGDQTFLLPNLLGTSVWNASVPNLPGVQFYNQAFVFDAAANPFGVTASNAGQGVVGL